MSGTRALWSAVGALAVGLSACGPPVPGGPAPDPAPRPAPAASARSAEGPGGPATAGPSVGDPSVATTATASAPGSAGASPSPAGSRPAPGSDPASPTIPTAPTAPAPWAPSACALTTTYLGDDLEAIPTGRRIAALTFDGGASSTGVSGILATLERQQVPATFFLTGDFARGHPTSTRAIAAAHAVGNHGENHRDLTTLSSSAVVDEIRRGAASIRTATGRSPGPWFRFPFGARDARTIGLVNDECYVAVRWTVDSLGWQGTGGGMTSAKVRDRVLAAARPGMVVLLHVGANPDDGTTLDADALPAIIEGLRARGYSFVSLVQAL